MFSKILALTLLVSAPAFADDCAPTVVDPNVLRDLSSVANRMQVDCPNQINVGELCQFVADKVNEPDTTLGTSYIYQTRIYKAACVERGDSPEVIKAKIQNFWNKYHDQLSCNVLNSNVRNGHLLKLAVDRSSTDFINDAVRRWKVNLNHVDRDNKTVLDFIEEEKTKSAGTPRENVLNRYYQIFRSNGAKLRREI